MTMSKPLSVDNWRLDPNRCDVKYVRRRIKSELKKWIDLMIEQADGQEGNVFRFDIIKNDQFFFTNCNDILSKDPECKAHETNPLITRRKIRVFMQLVLKQISGGPIHKMLKCTHCGFEGEEMRGTVNGHYRFCPKCKKIAMVGYQDTIRESAAAIFRELENEK